MNRKVKTYKVNIIKGIRSTFGYSFHVDNRSKISPPLTPSSPMYCTKSGGTTPHGLVSNLGSLDRSLRKELAIRYDGETTPTFNVCEVKLKNKENGLLECGEFGLYSSKRSMSETLVK